MTQPGLIVGAGDSVGFAALENLANDEIENQVAEVKNEIIKEGIKEGLMDDDEDDSVVEEDDSAEMPAIENKIPDLIKLLKVQSGDKSMELANNTTFTHKVNGKEVKVTAQELLNNYSGKVAYDAKLSEVENQRRSLARSRGEWETELTSAKQGLMNMVRLSREGKPLEALEYIYELAGADSGKLFDDYLEQIERAAEEYSGLTGTEKEMLKLQHKNNLLVNGQQRRTDKELAFRQEDEENHQIRQVLANNGIEAKNYLNAARTLFENGILKDDAGTDPVSAAQMVCDFAKDVSMFETIYSGIEAVDSDLTSDQSLVQHLGAIMKTGTGSKFTVSDVSDIVRKAFGKGGSRNKIPAPKGSLSKKVVKKANSEKVNSQWKQSAGVGFDGLEGSLFS